MNTETIFWFEIVVIALQLIAVYVMGRTLIVISKSDLFKEKVNRLHDRKEKEEKESKTIKLDPNSTAKTLLVAVLGLTATASTAISQVAEEAAEVAEATSRFPDYLIYSLGAMIIVLTGVIMYFRRLIVTFLEIDKVEEVKEVPVKETVTYKVMHALTDAVDVEEEHKVMTDHEYDGIRELDNNLPPWWKYGFYVSIVAGVIYLTNYHILKTGDLQTAEYQKEIEEKEMEVAAYLKSKALNVDEYSVVMLDSEADLMAGKSLFTKYCVVCHEADGGGKVGPNLTDPYWIYDGDIAGVFSTIKYGAKRGMKSWQDELNPVQIQKLASYVLTFQGTTPADPKPPEGDLFEDPTLDPEVPTEGLEDKNEEPAAQEDKTVAENQ